MFLINHKKTGRALIVHEEKVFGGFGGEIASTISDEMFKYLDAPVKRIGSKNTQWVLQNLTKMKSY
jgi:2-oxoisovalerate dehydrogenase E1 component